MNSATPSLWTGASAAENVRTGFRSIFEHAPLPAARCNPQAVIIEMNSAFARALQAGLADRRALRLSDLVAPDDREATESLLHNLLACTCDSIRLAGRDTAKNGQAGLAVTNWVAWRLPGPGEEPNHASLEEGLILAQRGEPVGQLAGGVVHDFNNLLAGVMLYCDLLLTRLDSRDRRRRYVNEIRSATMQATGLAQQLLVFALPQASQVRAALCLNPCVLLTVSDNACGTDTKTRQHLFEPFFTTKGAGKGTGSYWFGIDHRAQYCHHKRRTDSPRTRSGSRNPSHDPAALGIALRAPEFHPDVVIQAQIRPVQHFRNSRRNHSL